MIAGVDGARRQREGVRPRTGFRQRIARQRVRGQTRQIFFLLLFAGPALNRIVEQRILHVDDHRRRRIDLRQLLNRQDRLEEISTLPAVLLGNIDRHQTEIEAFLEDFLLENTGLVHLTDIGGDAFARELAHGGLKHRFFFSQVRERRRRGAFFRSDHHL